MPLLDMKRLESVIQEFHKFEASEGQTWKEERQAKDDFFGSHFTREGIRRLDEGALRQMVHLLWAFGSWTNKDYIFQEMLKSGMENIRNALDQLLYSGEPVSKRFDYVRSQVKNMGPTCISEILAHHDPQKYPIWSSKSKAGLLSLGIPASSLPKSSQIRGHQYAEFCELVGRVRSEIAAKYPEFVDLFTLDYLLFFVSSEMPISVSREAPPAGDFDHDAVVEEILALGDGLGFDVQKEFAVAYGSKIDAIWRSRIANLGTIAYAFEVQRKGSRDSAILNLQRVKQDASIQKVIIVSSEEELERFRQEIASIPGSFRETVCYFSVDHLQEALGHVDALKNLLKTLGLLYS